jgi:hypothetical protein
MIEKGILKLLTDQVSNLDSSVPKTDVLPITPSVIIPLIGSTNIGIIF